GVNNNETPKQKSESTCLSKEKSSYSARFYMLAKAASSRAKSTFIRRQIFQKSEKNIDCRFKSEPNSGILIEERVGQPKD
ncbi:MAG: hypothetical protein II486_04515, partial [Thermoguttaceae bacterium]|nr:hypothetical protein [Thermoguttaceae bacterium]